jgi:hypothetical protein
LLPIRELKCSEKEKAGRPGAGQQVGGKQPAYWEDRHRAQPDEKILAPEGNSLSPGTGSKKLVILHRNGEKHYSNLIL